MNTRCFATLALGPQYRALARLLAGDLQRLFPDLPLIVLTDQPAEFLDSNNVCAFKHANRGVYYCYHDKRFALAKALSLYATCIFLDADCRVGQTPPKAFWNSITPGIHGFWVQSLETKLSNEAKAKVGTHPFQLNLNTPARIARLMAAAAKAKDIDFSEVAFFPEQFLAVCADREQARLFIKTWDELSDFFHLRGFGWGEGCAIGMAAQKARLSRGSISAVDEWLFKDHYVKARVALGLSVPRWASVFENERREIEERFRKGCGNSNRHRVARYALAVKNAAKILIRHPDMKAERLFQML